MVNSTPLQLSRSILDPIHGLIRMTEEEYAVMDHPIFRRLRRVKQNGLLYLVFPSATHTRFEHSLGALFVADGVLQGLYFNSFTAIRKKTIRSLANAREGEAADLCSLTGAERTLLFQVTRLAALVHDLGHGPLSHTFEKFGLKVGRLKTLLDDSRLKPLKSVRDVLIEYNDGGKDNQHVKHEVLSCLFFALAWHGIGDAIIPTAVTGAIIGPPAIERLSDAFQRSWIPLVHDIIASAPADADRMDYLERDSRSVGVTYGLFDRNRLLKSFLPYREPGGGSPRYRLGLKLSGLRAVENFIQARFELFVQIYYHKTNRAIQLMLDQVSKLSQAAGLEATDAGSLDGLVKSYVELSDDEFLGALRGKDGSSFRGHAPINALATSIHERRLWKRILDCKSVPEAEYLKSLLEKEHSGVSLLVDKKDPEATKDLSRGAALLERDASGVYSLERGRSWLDASRLIRALSQEEDALVRVYFMGSDLETAARLRKTALALPLPAQ